MERASFHTALMTCRRVISSSAARISLLSVYARLSASRDWCTIVFVSLLPVLNLPTIQFLQPFWLRDSGQRSSRSCPVHVANPFSHTSRQLCFSVLGLLLAMGRCRRTSSHSPSKYMKTIRRVQKSASTCVHISGFHWMRRYSGRDKVGGISSRSLSQAINQNLEFISFSLRLLLMRRRTSGMSLDFTSPRLSISVQIRTSCWTMFWELYYCGS